MTHPNPAFQPDFLWRRPRMALSILGIACLLTTAAHSAPPPARIPSTAITAEEATPDCDDSTPTAFPARQREHHLAELGVDVWQKAGILGKGVKIAVLDTGFRGYRKHLGSVLPRAVEAKSFRQDHDLEAPNSQHGLLCAEVVHAMAPEADLLLANWDGGRPDEFLAAIRWAKEKGAKVITCSVIMPSWSDGEGGGAVNEALYKLVGNGEHPDDILFFASAGNTAQRHWSGHFVDGGNGWHQWKKDRLDNTVTPWGTDRVSVELYCQPGTEYEVRVVDASSGVEVGAESKVGYLDLSPSPFSSLLTKLLTPSSHYRGTDRNCDVVSFKPHPWGQYNVRVRKIHGDAGNFHLSVLGGGLALTTEHGSVACPADGPGAIAVGAVHADGERANYSSCGPNSHLPKPDFVAPVPFPSLWRERPFSGTSAAAPQAAGLAVLCWCHHTDWTAGQVRGQLQKAAHDLGTPGVDPETGYGMIALPAK